VDEEGVRPRVPDAPTSSIASRSAAWGHTDGGGG
jgi:hypothetical protein